MNNLEKRWKGGDLRLFDHQWNGVEEMEQWFENGHGGICADEMGLGKTCTTIVTMTRQVFKGKGPFFVLSPLSVCEHWEKEVKKFSGGHLEPFRFTGSEPLRQTMLDKLKFSKKTVFITAGHLLRQKSTLEVLRHLQKKMPFTTFAIDEAQCVKNPASQLAKCLKTLIHRYVNPHFILLTGTPIQNNLGELYALLTLSDPIEFPPDEIDQFSDHYVIPEHMPELKGLLKKYMFRRTKDEVFKKELKDCEQIILYHGISELQKEVYRNTLAKNAGALRRRKVCASLTQVFIELRKCVLHPYIIPGVEPEPFIEGEHLVDASGKLQVLDRLLKYMIPRGHRALIFSQFLQALDIIEDFLRMRGWKYVRISGSTGIEERVEFVGEFQEGEKDGPVCFLLSTKAGGVGLNLTAADTAIFFDSDWNPQNDIQAMARCHRIGQTKPVKIIRLVGRSTIDQYVVATAREKLKLTDAIIGAAEVQLAALDVVDSLQRDFETLMTSNTAKFQCTDEELEKMIGASEGDLWLPIEKDSNVVRFLDPDDHGQDIDRNDYTMWEGKSNRDATYTDTWENIIAGCHELPTKRRRSVASYSEASQIPSIRQMREAEKEMLEEWKKPSNGFLLFVSEQKKKNTAKEHPNLAAGEVRKIYGAEWAKLSPAEQDAYAIRAGRVEKEKEPPKNGWGLFRSIQEPILKAEGVPHLQMTKVLSEKWRALKASERKKYNDTVIWGPQGDVPWTPISEIKEEIKEEEPDTEELDRIFQHLGE